MSQHFSTTIFPIGRGLFYRTIVTRTFAFSQSQLPRQAPCRRIWCDGQRLPFTIPLFLAAGHYGSIWIRGCAHPPPECGPLEPKRWEEPRLGGVLGPGGRRGGGSCGRWEEPRGSGCRGEATLRSAPRAWRTGRGADIRGSGRGLGSRVPHRAPGTRGLWLWGGGVRRCRPRGTAQPCLTRSQAAAAGTIRTRSGWKLTIAGECPGVEG